MREWSLHSLDVLRDSVEVGAMRIALSTVEDLQSDMLTIRTADNGGGMTAKSVRGFWSPLSQREALVT